MAEIITAEYPVRYVAWDNPQTLVISDSEEKRVEMAVFANSMPNKYWPHITDGIYIEAGWHFGGGYYFVSEQYTSPDRERRQSSTFQRFTSWADALQYLRNRLNPA